MRGAAALLILKVTAMVGFGASPLTAQSIPSRVTQNEKDIAQLKRQIQAGGPQGPAGPREAKGEGVPQELSGSRLKNVRFGDGYARFDNKSGRRVVYIGSGTSENGYSRFYNKNGTDVAFIGSGTSENGYARLRNKSGKQVVYIGAGTSEDGYARFYNKNGTNVVYIGSGTSESGYARFYNTGGREVVYIGSSTTGRGLVQVNGKKVHDYAEIFELATREGVLPGTVMSVVKDGVAVAPSVTPYDPKVVGVVSGAGGFTPGMRIGTREDGSHDLPIAMSGQVYVRVCLEGGPVQAGDLLVASSRPGVAMRAADRSKAFGAVVGKALAPYDGEPGETEGSVRMLVMSR